MKSYKKPEVIKKPELPKPCVKILKPNHTEKEKELNKLGQGKL